MNSKRCGKNMCVCRVDNVPLGLFTLSAWLRLVTSKVAEMRQCTHLLRDSAACVRYRRPFYQEMKLRGIPRKVKPLHVSVKDRQPISVSKKKRFDSFNFSTIHALPFFMLSKPVLQPLFRSLVRKASREHTAEIKNCVNAQKKSQNRQKSAFFLRTE